MHPDLLHLKAYLSAAIDMSEDTWNDFSSIWMVDKAPRKTILTHSGEKESWLYFITDGVQRIYFSDDSGREATLVLTYPHSFAGVVDSFILQIPSGLYFETLSHSTFLKVGFLAFQEVRRQHPCFDLLVEKMSALALRGLLERMAELQCYSSEEKFRSLLRRSPHILQRVPHKYLANYLGIDPTNFSKLMNSVRI